MVGELMTLPVRAGVRVTRFAFNTTLTVSARALTLAGDVLQSFTGQHEDAPSPPQRRQNGAAADERPSRAPNGTPPKRAPSSRASSRPKPASETAAEPAAQTPAEPAAQTPPRPVDVPPEPADAQPEPEPEPIHVSEEPELVAEVAEPGAEEGAGASITVDEPWEGYAHLSAKDIVDRLAGADSAELAAIQLFESTHKKRETVLTAVERELRKENASPRPDRPH